MLDAETTDSFSVGVVRSLSPFFESVSREKRFRIFLSQNISSEPHNNGYFIILVIDYSNGHSGYKLFGLCKILMNSFRCYVKYFVEDNTDWVKIKEEEFPSRL